MAGRQFEYDVAVVGAGPVGATLAALLGQAGVRVFVADRSNEVYPLPRAAHFDHEVMRIFQQLGLVDQIAGSIVSADRYTFQNAAGDILLDFNLDTPAETGWTGYMMHQPGIESAIRNRLASDALVDLRTGTTYQGLQLQDRMILSRWQDDAGEFEVRSRFLVGCDGAWSPVREEAGIGHEDLGFDEPWLVLDLEVDPDNGFPGINTQYCDPRRPTTYVIMGNNRRRFEFMLKPGELADEMLTEAAVSRLLEAWDCRGLRRVERKAVYRFHALVAERWRLGNVFIAGDAAHQMPPFAGQGMCSGIRDAAALAWRLELALRHGMSAHLADSYQTEREPHVRAITAAAIATGQVVCTLDEDMATARDAQMLAARAQGDPAPDIGSPPLNIVFGLPASPRAGERFIQPVIVNSDGSIVRMDDVLGTGAWLISREPADSDLKRELGIHTFALNSVKLRHYRGAILAWLDSAGADAVLIRPDRYVFGTGTASLLGRAYADQAVFEHAHE